MRARSSKAKIGQQARVSQFMTMRLSGMSLRDIGDKQTPPISPQAVHKCLKAALSNVLTETAEQARCLEALRLDQLLGAIWPQAMLGDLAVVDRVLAIMARRSKLLGLDQRPGYFGASDSEIDGDHVRVEIIGSPEPERLAFLESEVLRLRDLEASISPDVPPSSTTH